MKINEAERVVLYDALNCLRRLRTSIRHSSTCRAPQAYHCSCDADTLWAESADIIKSVEALDDENAKRQ